MKRLSKARIMERDGCLEVIWRERAVMSKFKSPFLVNLLYAFQDETTIFLLMPFMQGAVYQQKETPCQNGMLSLLVHVC